MIIKTYKVHFCSFLVVINQSTLIINVHNYDRYYSRFLSDFNVIRTVTLIETGLSQCQRARRFDVSQLVISILWNRYLELNTIKNTMSRPMEISIGHRRQICAFMCPQTHILYSQGAAKWAKSSNWNPYIIWPDKYITFFEKNHWGLGHPGVVEWWNKYICGT